MGAALCGCLALVAILVVYRRARQRAAKEIEAENENALDRGLALLIKDISRHRDAPLAARTITLPPLRAMPLRRAPRGTPTDLSTTPLPDPLDDEEAPTTISSVWVERR